MELRRRRGGFRSELQDAVAARVWGCAGMGDEVQGVAGVRFKESGRGFLGVHAVERGRDAQRGFWVSGRAEGERKEGDDTWGRQSAGGERADLRARLVSQGEGMLAGRHGLLRGEGCASWAAALRGVLPAGEERSWAQEGDRWLGRSGLVHRFGFGLS